MKMMTEDEIIALKEEAYQRGFQDGFRQGLQSRPPNEPYHDLKDRFPPYPSNPHIVWETNCRVCGIDLSKATHYCCQNTSCPGRVSCCSK